MVPDSSARRLSAPFIAALLAAAALPFLPSSSTALAPTDAVDLPFDLLKDLPGLPALDPDDPHRSAIAVLESVASARGGDPRLVDELLDSIEPTSSPSGVHIRFLGRHEGLNVLGVSGAVHFDASGKPWLASLQLPAGLPPDWISQEPGERRFVEAARAASAEEGEEGWHQATSYSPLLHVTEGPTPLWHWTGGEFLEAYRAILVARDAVGPEAAGWSVLLHPAVPALDRAEPRWFEAEGTGRIFAVSPEVVAKDPNLVDDPNGEETPQMAALTSIAAVHRLDQPATGDYKLQGQWVYVNTTTTDPDATFEYSRSDPRFEDTMAYHHMDFAQSEIQRLGFFDNDEAQEVTEPEVGLYNAFYWFADKITFGYHAASENGLVDAAEDADVIVHEYGHAVQFDVLPPELYSTNEGRAIAEGFADLFAVLILMPANEGYDMPCLGDWFGSYLDSDRTDGVPYCFRRTDSGLTYPDVYGRGGHYAGQVISGLIWNVTLATDRDTALRLALEANHLMPMSEPTLPMWAEAVLHASDALYGGQHNLTVAWSAHDRLLDTPFSAAVLGLPYVDPIPPGVVFVAPESTWPGQTVWVGGRAFVSAASPGAPTVQIGDVAVQPYWFSTDGSGLEFVAPPLDLGAYTLTVVRSDGLELPYDRPFRIVEGIVVTGPPGPHFLAAGDELTLTGSGLGPTEGDPNRTTAAYTYSYDDHEWIQLDSSPDRDGTELEIRLDEDLAGRHQYLLLARSDGLTVSVYDFFIHLPDLAVEVELVDQEAAALLLPMGAGGAPEWIMRVRNVGSGPTDFASADNPFAWVWAQGWEGSFSFGYFLYHFDLTTELGPGEAMEVPIDLHPTSACVDEELWPLYCRNLPVGNWKGTAAAWGGWQNEQAWENNQLDFSHRFLLPEEVPGPTLPPPFPG